jgi:hypothetical protein
LEHADGVRQPIEFTDNDFKGVYDGILAQLYMYKGICDREQSRKLSDIQQNLFKQA